jgi:hypothetical protein
LSDLRDRDNKTPIVYFSDHDLNLQRAYRIVCIMVGSDPVKFKEFANITKLPEPRQETSKNDYEKAVSGWDSVLKPFTRGPDQPKIKIECHLRGWQGGVRPLRSGISFCTPVGCCCRSSGGPAGMADAFCIGNADLRKCQCDLE